MGAIQQIFSQNPAYSKVMNLIQNKNPQEIEQIVRNTFQTQGIDVNKFAKEKFGFDISNIQNNSNLPYKQ